MTPAEAKITNQALTGGVKQMPESDQRQINDALMHLRNVIEVYGSAGHIALAILGTELAMQN